MLAEGVAVGTTVGVPVEVGSGVSVWVAVAVRLALAVGVGVMVENVMLTSGASPLPTHHPDVWHLQERNVWYFICAGMITTRNSFYFKKCV